MNIYEIDHAMEALVDPETGELMDFEAFEALAMERERKIDNMIKMIKNQLALADALKKEIETLSGRVERARKRAKGLRTYLALILNGEKYSSASGEVSYRKSQSVEVDDRFVDWAKKNHPDLLKIKEPVITADKTAIKELFKTDPSQAETIPFIQIVSKTNMQIK